MSYTSNQVLNYTGRFLLAGIGLFIVLFSTKQWKKRQIKLRRERQIPIEPLPNYDWRSTKPRQLRPFKPIYNMSMGIQQDPVSNLIQLDNEYLERTMGRRSIVQNYGKTVYGYLPGGESAVQELMASPEPGFQPSLHKTQTCLRALAETVEEDLFLLKETETTHLCLAFACCHPTGFDPSTKLGADLSEIHGPVPHYDKIGPSMERYFRKLQVGKSVKRMNWNIQIGTEIINVAGNHIKEGDTFVADEEVDCDQGFLRVELQSLARLPETKFILFCFKTYMYPLRDLKTEGSGPELADAIDGLLLGNASGMNKYKGAIRWGKSIKEYLRS